MHAPDHTASLDALDIEQSLDRLIPPDPHLPRSLAAELDAIEDDEQRRTIREASARMPRAEILRGRDPADAIELVVNDAGVRIRREAQTHRIRATEAGDLTETIGAEAAAGLQSASRQYMDRAVATIITETTDQLAQAETMARAALEADAASLYAADPQIERMARDRLADVMPQGPKAVIAMLDGVLRGQGAEAARVHTRIASEVVAGIQATPDHPGMATALGLAEVLPQVAARLEPETVRQARSVLAAIPAQAHRLAAMRAVIG